MCLQCKAALWWQAYILVDSLSVISAEKGFCEEIQLQINKKSKPKILFYSSSPSSSLSCSLFSTPLLLLFFFLSFLLPQSPPHFSPSQFLEAFHMTQMFENFIEERENPAKAETTAQSTYKSAILLIHQEYFFNF